MNPILKRSGVFFFIVASLFLLAPLGFAADGAKDDMMSDLDESAELARLNLSQPRYRVAPPRRSPRRSSTNRPGLSYIGIGGVGVFNLSTKADVTELIKSGGGFSLFAGTRTSPYLGLEVNFTGTVHDFTPKERAGEQGVLESASIDGKIFLAPQAVRFEPFIQVGVGYYVLSSDLFVSTQLHGMGLQFGGGVDIRLNPAVAVGFRALYKGVFVNNDYEYGYWGVEPESAFLNLMTSEVNVQFYF